MTFALNFVDLARAPAPTGTAGRIKTWWSSDRIVCTCNRSTWLCRHVYQYLLDGEDVGLHTVISKTTLGKTFSRYIPLSNQVIVEFIFTVIQHPGDPSEYIIHATEANGDVQAILTRHDGLIILVNSLRDYYSSVPQFHESFSRIIRKKRLACERPSHNRQNDLDLVERIKAAIKPLAAGRPHTDEDVVLVAEELALEEAYYLKKHAMCFSCHSYTDYSADIPKV